MRTLNIIWILISYFIHYPQTHTMQEKMDPKRLVEHIMAPVMIKNTLTQQMFDEILHLSYFLEGFKPHNILEVGAKGGTFGLFSRLSTGIKVAIDIEEDFRKFIHLSTTGIEDVHFLCENSQIQETFDKVKEICPQFDFIFIDGDHTYQGVKNDFNLYKKLLSPRGVMVFHDIDPLHQFRGDEYAGGNAWLWWKELDEGVKSELICQHTDDRRCIVNGSPNHLGGLGFWRKTSNF